MKTPELMWRLRVEGGFATTPLIDSTGTVAGVHLTRFARDGHIEVLQVWNEEWAAFARIPNQLNPDAPLSAATPEETRVGRLEDVAPPLLNKPPHARHTQAAPFSCTPQANSAQNDDWPQ